MTVRAQYVHQTRHDNAIKFEKFVNEKRREKISVEEKNQKSGSDVETKIDTARDFNVCSRIWCKSIAKFVGKAENEPKICFYENRFYNRNFCVLF